MTASFVSTISFQAVAADSVNFSAKLPLWSDQSLMIDLIRSSRMVSSEVLAQVAEMARVKRADVVDLLYENGFLAQSDRRALLDCASAVSKNWLFKPWAITALRKAVSEFVPFEQVLQELNLHPDNAFAGSIVGDICIATGIVSRQEFDQARYLSLSQGLSLGQSLANLGYLPVTLYKAIIDGISRLRTGQLNSVQLRQKIRNESNSFSDSDGKALSARIDLAHSTVGFSLYAHNRCMLEVLDLLIEAGCVSEMVVLGLFEVALERSATFESVWEEAQPVSRAVLNKAAQLQKQVEQGLHQIEAHRILSQFEQALQKL